MPCAMGVIGQPVQGSDRLTDPQRSGKRCPVCGYEELRTLFPHIFPDKDSGGTREFELLVCLRCGLGFLDPQPSDEFLAREVYNESYPLYESGWVGARASLQQQVYRTMFPHPLLQLIPKQGGRALDVGCGSGYWMSRLRNLGWDMTGLDFTEKALSKVRSMGFAAISGSIESVRLEEEAYDLILLSAVLEHLHDPLAALRNVWSALKPGGCAVIDVPNFGSAEVRIFQKDWSLFSVAHLFYFTEDALSRALRKTRFVPEVFARRSSELTFGYSLARKMSAERGNAMILLGSPFQFILNALNQSGELFCRARKPT